ncbi:MAG: response regulator transcription factor, partial [Aeromicrobium sp.]
AYMRGRWDRTVELCEVGPGAPAMFDAYLQAVGLLVAAGRGDVDQIERTLPLRSLWRHEVASSVHSSSALVDLYGVMGDLSAARQAYEHLVELETRVWEEPLFPGRVRIGALLVGQYGTAAPSLDRTEQAALLEQAAEIGEIVEAVVEDNPIFGPEGQAWRRRAHAEIARLRWLCGVEAPPAERLVELWRETRDLFVTLGDPYEVARSDARLAAVLLTAGGETEGIALIAEARAIAERLAARPLLAELDLLRPRPVRSEADLTPREVEVLQQVAAGLSNGEIGARLFISTKTVSVHVSNILAKLGASGRTEAAAIARRKGLLGD